MTDIFIETVKGHYPASNNAGASRHWTDINGVPMPDRSLGTLFWISLLGGVFGLDHFYLRSPLTGLLKLITFGGIGLWYLWDVLQISTEADRVKLYGLSTPLDITTGIAQGMITDATNYTQPTSFIAYAALAMLGLEALAEGKFALLIRRVCDAAAFIPATIHALTATNTLGVRVVSAVFAVIFGIFLFLPWLAVVAAVVGGAEDGISIPPQVDKLVNYFSFYTRTLGTHVDPDNANSHTIVERVLRDEFGYNNVPPEEFKNKFRIMHKEDVRAASAANSNGDTTSKWMPALWMGPLIPGVITRLVSAIPFVGSYVKFGIFSAFGDTAAARQEMLYMNPATAAAAYAAESAGINTGAIMNTVGAVQGTLSAAQGAAAGLKDSVHGTRDALRDAVTMQTGGGSGLSTESKVMGATLFALIVGGAIKGVVDHCVA